jgi:hypothetical protein
LREADERGPFIGKAGLCHCKDSQSKKAAEIQGRAARKR